MQLAKPEHSSGLFTASRSTSSSRAAHKRNTCRICPEICARSKHCQEGLRQQAFRLAAGSQVCRCLHAPESSASEDRERQRQPASIRSAGPADSDDLADLIQLCGGFWTGEQLAAESLEERTVLLLAEDGDDSVVGGVLIWCIADEAQVMELAVHPDRRRSGIGRRLLTQALELSSRKVKQRAGRGAALLEVMVGNVPAISLYEDLGFKRTGVRKAYYPDGSDAILMRRPIR